MLNLFDIHVHLFMYLINQTFTEFLTYTHTFAWLRIIIPIRLETSLFRRRKWWWWKRKKRMFDSVRYVHHNQIITVFPDFHFLNKPHKLFLCSFRGAINIGTWFLCVIDIVHGGWSHGSPSICIGKLLRVLQKLRIYKWKSKQNIFQPDNNWWTLTESFSTWSNTSIDRTSMNSRLYSNNFN